ncbi:hypothetical protein FEM33_01665 [Dyadobacter flavalbus]|uniref:HK97 gp10 family phage protein n=1 Tax=Dyadobacter flavalbus TaxID=2579942 RepID=A0A5M8R1P0_9BACT|nr:hypothetical protein [Dyadobacter flavalbus]KAA6441468.1 hypothetical protein FEM33_01665 [Dyadobacter flavalbus]
MAIKATFDQNSIAAYIQSKVDKIDQAILNRLKYLGEQLVNHAREFGSYMDQTGNLRNSIGYVILKDGKMVVQNFQKTSQKPGAKGVREGQQLANSLKVEFPKGYALIVVAGMNYAASVESRGRNVLDSAEQLAKTEMPRMISELKLNINKMK